MERCLKSLYSSFGILLINLYFPHINPDLYCSTFIVHPFMVLIFGLITLDVFMRLENFNAT